MYSEIISAKAYIEIMNQHVYMRAADQCVARTAIYYALKANARTVLDVGCGPGRITKLLAEKESLEVTGVDIDSSFLKYAENYVPSARFVEADLLSFRSSDKFSVVVSHGLDHHIDPEYLRNLKSCLADGGVYVLGDEFLPPYSNNHERKVRAVIWYAHVISNALKNGHDYLAVEEVKTLLDDLSYMEEGQKNESQISLVLARVQEIEDLSSSRDSVEAGLASEQLLRDLGTHAKEASLDPSVYMSRGDYKVGHKSFVEKVQSFGFKVLSLETVGPVNTIGGFGVYVLSV